MARGIAHDEFEDLYRSTAPALFGYLGRRGFRDPDDLVAEVFLIAWRRRTGVPGPLFRRAWLFGIARNLLLEHARTQKREEAVLAQLAFIPPPTTTGNLARASEAAQLIGAALDRLAPADREILLLIEWERLTPAEAALTLCIRPGTARVRLHRARAALAADPDLAQHRLSNLPS